MPKIIPILLWIIVGCMLVVLMYLRTAGNARDAGEQITAPNGHSSDPPGAVLVDIPWKHLPDVSQFELTDQNGNAFDSSKLAGQTYLVSFFFATCPDICRQLNDQIANLNEQLKKEDVTFVSITVDPKHDTPEILQRYAQDYDADPDRWVFLTGQPYQVKQLGEHVLRVVVDKATHTDNILLVDNWGRYRDRFKWDDPYDMKRLVQEVKDVSVEQQPPLESKVHTRNVLAGQPPMDLNIVPWVREFHLNDQDGETFYSRDLTGQVWIGNFFFVSCPGICKQQAAYLQGLHERLGDDCPPVVSITTDPIHDTPAVLKQHSRKLGADQNWKFCTGPSLLIRRLASEFFKAHVDGGHHSTELFVVDRWHRVRGAFDWQIPEDEIAMLKLIEQLKAESEPGIFAENSEKTADKEKDDSESESDALE